MGRRALPRIDPDLDVTGWLLQEEDLPDTLSSENLFQRQSPLEVEIGTGKGLFLQTATEACPDRDFVGIEIAGKYAHFAAARLASHARHNGKLIRGDGIRILNNRVAAESLAAVHVYFPDPWWKRRHRKRRVMNEDSVQCIQRVLQPGGKLHFWTDVQEYFETTLKLIARSTSLGDAITPDETPVEHDLDYRTHFERRMRRHGRPIYRAVYTK